MRSFLGGTCLALLLCSACSSDTVDSDEQARRAYLGLDTSVEKSLTLGFQGFNAASNANIPAQMTAGDKSGTLTIGGQVDAGTSINKQMRLTVGMVMYSDGPFAIDMSGHTATITYDTDAATATQPQLDLSLHNFPNGTFTGTLMGTYHLSGDIKGDATLNLTFTGDLMDDGTGKTVRKPGTTTVTGTATNADGGMYTVNVMI
jgi:hypothetical protein